MDRTNRRNCTQFQYRELLYLYNELSSEERARFKTHLHKCSTCQERLEMTRKIISDLEPSNLQPSQECQTKIKSLIYGQPVSVPRQSLLNCFISRFKALRWSAVIAATAAVLILTIGLFILLKTSHIPPVPQPSFTGVTDLWEDDISAELTSLSNLAQSLDREPELFPEVTDQFENQIGEIKESIDNVLKELETMDNIPLDNEHGWKGGETDPC